MKLYYMETMNPRKVSATAKYLRSPMECIPIDRVPGGLKGAEYMAINPNGRAPVLVDGELKLWESAAIMMHLAIQAKDDLWPLSDPARQVEIVRCGSVTQSWSTFCDGDDHASRNGEKQ
jgi:glutathione S-transferase